MVCVDLEDAVPPDGKDAARQAAMPWFQEESGRAERAVRINSLKTRAGLTDLLAASQITTNSGLIVLPKVDGPGEIILADAVLTEAGSQAGLIGLIESVDGLEHVQLIASASPRLSLLLFGAVDLATELGCEIAAQPLIYARSRIVHGARTAGIGVLDVPSLDFRNHETVEREALEAKSFGFTGKAVLHPSNVEVVNRAFTPTADQLAYARRVIDAFNQSATGLVVLDGKLIEHPVIKQMEQIVDAAAVAVSQ
jgi:citrate lyase subunit beta/citryl-CoA lyase/(S)-citramalyl-CoA lyase